MGEQESLDLHRVTPSTEKHEVEKEKQAEVTESAESTAAESVSIRNRVPLTSLLTMFIPL